MPRIYTRTSPYERMMRRVTPNAKGCLEYGGSRNDKGYAVVSLGGGRVVYGHRLALAHKLGIDEAKIVCALHSCDNPCCVNGAHLSHGTHKSNSDDRRSRGRGVTVIRSGEKHHACRLTDAQVAEIRAVLAKAPRSKTGRSFRRGVLLKLAATYGVSVTHLSELHYNHRLRVSSTTTIMKGNF